MRDSRPTFDGSILSAMPDDGHLMSMLIMTRGSSGTSDRSTDPLVSRTTWMPFPTSLPISSTASGWSIGSPPVRHTRKQSPTRSSTSPTAISSPPSKE